MDDHPIFYNQAHRKVCDLCGEYAGVPFEWCKFCQKSWVWHHGRCCLNESNPRREETLRGLGVWSCTVQYIPSGTTYSANANCRPAPSAGTCLDPLPPAPHSSSHRSVYQALAPPPTREECQAKAHGNKTWSNRGTRSNSSSSSTRSFRESPARKKPINKCTQSQCSYTRSGNKFYCFKRDEEHGSWTEYSPPEYQKLSAVREGRSSTGGS